MYKQLKFAISIIVVVFAFVAGYTLFADSIFTPTRVQARSLTMPANPHILFLTREGLGTQRGMANNIELQNRKATLAHDWSAVRNQAAQRPLDALIIDAPLLNEIDTTNQTWLKSQFQDGVVIVGLGTEDDQLTRYLGFDESLNSRPGNPPIQATEFRLLQSMVIGQPDEVKLIKESDWLDQAIRGEAKPVAAIKSPLVSSFTNVRGKLDTPEDLDHLFSTIHIAIEGAYQYIERVDDLPVLFGLLQQMGIQAILGDIIVPHGNWEELTHGWVITIWLMHILSEQNHCIEPVQKWVEKHIDTLRRLRGQKVKALDFSTGHR